MSSREVEGGVDKFLNGLVDGGKAAHGVVLVKSLPSSKYASHSTSVSATDTVQSPKVSSARTLAADIAAGEDVSRVGHREQPRDPYAELRGAAGEDSVGTQGRGSRRGSDHARAGRLDPGG